MHTRRRFLAGAAAVGSLAGCLAPRQVDHAAYSTAGDTIPDVDYEGVQQRATEAGYRVAGPYYVNAKRELGRPLDVPALTEQFGADARVVLTQFRYSPTRFLEADFTAQGSGVRLVFFDDDLGYGQPFEPANLPPDDWLRDRFGLLFDLTESETDALLAAVKAAAAGAEDNIVTHDVDHEPTLTAVHGAFSEAATETSVSPTYGDGWANVEFRDDDGVLGQFSVVVPSVRISTTDGGHDYRIKLDRLGGLNLVVLLDAGDTIPESEYRSQFREMFEALGLPADRVAEYTFEYTPSNW
jgi:hypothetical protein